MMDETWYPMSPLTLVSSEMAASSTLWTGKWWTCGITLWDGRGL